MDAPYEYFVNPYYQLFHSFSQPSLPVKLICQYKIMKQIVNNPKYVLAYNENIFEHSSFND